MQDKYVVDLERLMRKDAFGMWSCVSCSYTSQKSSNMKSHIESIHLPPSPHNCLHCGKVFRNRNSFNCHMKKHRAKPVGEWLA